jgi:hypothetical protein
MLTASDRSAGKCSQVADTAAGWAGAVWSGATVAEMGEAGHLTVLRQGTNEWICVPANQNVVGATDMCLDPIGMVWMKDITARKISATSAMPTALPEADRPELALTSAS